MSCIKGCSFKVVTSQSVLAWLGAVSVCSKSWKWQTDSMSCVIPWHFSSVQSASPLVFALLSVTVNRLSKTCFVTCYFVCFPPHHPTSLLVNFRNPFSSVFIQRFFIVEATQWDWIGSVPSKPSSVWKQTLDQTH